MKLSRNTKEFIDFSAVLTVMLNLVYWIMWLIYSGIEWLLGVTGAIYLLKGWIFLASCYVVYLLVDEWKKRRKSEGQWNITLWKERM